MYCNEGIIGELFLFGLIPETFNGDRDYCGNYVDNPVINECSTNNIDITSLQKDLSSFCTGEKECFSNLNLRNYINIDKA